MRRIYESNAIRRDNDDPFSPAETEEKPSAMRSVNSLALSRAVVPDRLRRFGLSLTLSTPRTEYERGEAVPFTVAMRNSMPFPISLSTRSPILWTWSVDGLEEASKLEREVPDEEGALEFDRGERKLFRKRWEQVFQVSETEWERAPPGEHTIAAGINVEGAESSKLYDETTIRIVD